jgi:hypothetical protein
VDFQPPDWIPEEDPAIKANSLNASHGGLDEVIEKWLDADIHLPLPIHLRMEDLFVGSKMTGPSAQLVPSVVVLLLFFVPVCVEG